MRSRGVCTPLKITAGGNLVPLAATARVTVKLLFSSPQDFTRTVLLPRNSRVLLDGSSNCLGVSSILNSLDNEWPQHWWAAITNPMKFDYLLLEIVWKLLGKGSLSLKADWRGLLDLFASREPWIHWSCIPWWYWSFQQPLPQQWFLIWRTTKNNELLAWWSINFERTCLRQYSELRWMFCREHSFISLFNISTFAMFSQITLNLSCLWFVLVFN